MALRRYRSVFCSVGWPLHPGRSGGEIRDFHLLRHLLTLSRVEFFALNGFHADGRADALRPLVDALHTPESVTPPPPVADDPEAAFSLGAGSARTSGAGTFPSGAPATPGIRKPSVRTCASSARRWKRPSPGWTPISSS